MTHTSGLPLDEQLTALQYYIDWTDIAIFIGVIGLLAVGIWKLKHRKKSLWLTRFEKKKMKTRLLIIIGIIAIVSTGSFVTLFQTQLTNSDETHLSSLLNGDSLCFDSFDEESVEICYSLNELGTYGCSMPLLEYLAQYSNLLDADAPELFYIEWTSLPNNISEKDYDACIEFLNSVRLPLK